MLDPTRMDDVLRRGADVGHVVAAWKSLDERRRKLQNELDTARQPRNAGNDRMAKLDKKSAEFATARDELKAVSGAGQGRRGRARAHRGRVRAGVARDPERAACERSGPVPARRTIPSITCGARSRRSRSRRSRTGSSAKRSASSTSSRYEDRRRAVHRAARRGVSADARRSSITCSICTCAHGYAEVWPPAIIATRARCAAPASCRSSRPICSGCRSPPGPDHVADNDLFLSPTAEVQVTNLHADEILDGATLPRKYCAYTPCFRAEAGADGKDTRGLIRQHQFDKVELVKIVAPRAPATTSSRRCATTPSASCRGSACTIASSRCAPATSASPPAKTYDLEVWLPGQDAYREISSCSNFEDFQARARRSDIKPNRRRQAAAGPHAQRLGHRDRPHDRRDPRAVPAEPTAASSCRRRCGRTSEGSSASPR